MSAGWEELWSGLGEGDCLEDHDGMLVVVFRLAILVVSYCGFMWFKKLSNFANLVSPVYLPTFALLAAASDNNETCDIVKIQEV